MNIINELDNNSIPKDNNSTPKDNVAEVKSLIDEIKDLVKNALWQIDWLHYHNYEHSIDVMERAIDIWKKEWLNDVDIEILTIWSLFHDLWFMEIYDNNEPVWAKLARDFLGKKWYSKEKIDIIEWMILSTAHKWVPNNIYDKILKDADTDNLWRDDFFEKWNNIRKELKSIKKLEMSEIDWLKFSIYFLQGHTFFTNTWNKERANKKLENLKAQIAKLDEISKK